MALNEYQVASLEGPGSKHPKPAPALTGEDLERAKAEAELASADKGYATARAQQSPHTGALAEAGASAAANLNNIETARHPETTKIIDALVEHLRRLTSSPRP